MRETETFSISRQFFSKRQAKIRQEFAISTQLDLGRLFSCLLPPLRTGKMEYRYQSVPHNCSLIEIARQKPMYGEFLEFYGFGEVPFEDLQFRGVDANFLEYVNEAKRLREVHIGLDMRKLEMGVERDALRMAISDSSNTLLLSAIDGGDILGVSITSTSGEPIRFLPPYLVKKIVGEFDSGRFIVSADLAETFGKFADFYRFAAAFDEGVITIRL